METGEQIADEEGAILRAEDPVDVKVVLEWV